MYFYGQKEVVRFYDLAVVGNSAAAVVAALFAAQNGKTTALVAPGEILFSEGSESLMGFLKENTCADFLKLLHLHPVSVGDGTWQVPSGECARGVLNALRSAGVHTYFSATPIGLLTDSESRCAGIAAATSFGAFSLPAAEVLDTTGFFAPQYSAAEEYINTLQFSGVHTTHSPGTSLGDLPEIGAWDLRIYPDCRTNDTYDLQYRMAADKTQLSYQAVKSAKNVVRRVLKRGLLNPEAHLLKTAFKPMELGREFYWRDKRLTVFKPDAFSFNEDYLDTLMRRLKDISTLAVPEYVPATAIRVAEREYPLAQLLTGKPLDAYLGADAQMLDTEKLILPVIDTPVAIIGGGTAGVAAAAGVSRQGVNAFVLESKYLLGGTRTLGRVESYWHGNPEKYPAQFKKDFSARFKEDTGAESFASLMAETFYCTELCNEGGCTCRCHAQVFGAKTQNGRLTEVLVALPEGAYSVRADIFTDATGTGSLAVHAGAEYEHSGDCLDYVPQGYSIWGETEPGRYSSWEDNPNHGDDDCLSAEYYTELLRGIYTTHPHSSPLGFSPYTTLREARRIKGQYVISLADMLTEKEHNDTVCCGKCIFDSHGPGSSPAYYSQLFVPLTFDRKGQHSDLRFKIPLRALIPQGVSNLLVVGKAISGTRDAASFVRMCPEIINTGLAAGLVAGYAAKQGVIPDEENAAELVREAGVEPFLSQWDDYGKEAPFDELIQKACRGDERAIMLLSAQKEALEPCLRAFKDRPNIHLGYVLAALGSDVSFDMLADAWEQEITDTVSHESAQKIMNMATLCSRVAYVYPQHRSRAVELLAKSLGVITAGGTRSPAQKTVYQLSKAWERRVPNFLPIMGLTVAASLIPERSLIEPLRVMAERENIRPEGEDDVHSLQLLLNLYAAAARSGDSSAGIRLLDFADDPHAFFRKFVCETLSEIYGVDADDPDARAQILKAPSKLTPRKELLPFWM